MSDEDIKLAFRGVSSENPLLLAIQEVLKQAKDQASDQAIGMGLSSDERHYASGMAYGIASVLSTIKELRA